MIVYISSDEVAALFEPSIKATVDAVTQLAQDSPMEIAVSDSRDSLPDHADASLAGILRWRLLCESLPDRRSEEKASRVKYPCQHSRCSAVSIVTLTEIGLAREIHH